MTTNTSSPNTPDPHNTKKSSNPKKCRFQYDDRKYIDRGQLYVLQISMAILKQGLEELNHGKVGRPFGFSNACFAAASLFRNATGIKYRQLQGLAEAIVGKVNAPIVIRLKIRKNWFNKFRSLTALGTPGMCSCLPPIRA